MAFADDDAIEDPYEFQEGNITCFLDDRGLYDRSQPYIVVELDPVEGENLKKGDDRLFYYQCDGEKTAQQILRDMLGWARGKNFSNVVLYYADVKEIAFHHWPEKTSTLGGIRNLFDRVFEDEHMAEPAERLAFDFS